MHNLKLIYIPISAAGFLVFLELFLYFINYDCSSDNSDASWISNAERFQKSGFSLGIFGDSRSRGNIDTTKLSSDLNVNCYQLAFENKPFMGLVDYFGKNSKNKILLIGCTYPDLFGPYGNKETEILIKKIGNLSASEVLEFKTNYLLTNNFRFFNQNLNFKTLFLTRDLFNSKRNKFNFLENRDLIADYYVPKNEDDYRDFYHQKFKHTTKDLFHNSKLTDIEANEKNLSNVNIWLSNNNKVFFIFHPLSGPYRTNYTMSKFSIKTLVKKFEQRGVFILDLTFSDFETPDFSHINKDNRKNYTDIVGKFVYKNLGQP